MSLPTEIRHLVLAFVVNQCIRQKPTLLNPSRCHHPCTLTASRKWTKVATSPRPAPSDKCTGYRDERCPSILLVSKQVFNEAVGLVWKAKDGGLRFCNVLCFNVFMHGITIGAGKELLMEARSVAIDKV